MLSYPLHPPIHSITLWHAHVQSNAPQRALQILASYVSTAGLQDIDSNMVQFVDHIYENENN